MAKTLSMEVVSQAEKSSSVDPRRWLMLAVLLLTTFLGTLDTYIVNVAVPFLPEERGRAFGSYVVTIGLASIMGQVLGGLLLAANILGLNWRSVGEFLWCHSPSSNRVRLWPARSPSS